MLTDRRHFLYLFGATLGTATLSTFPAALAQEQKKEADGPFILQSLPYAYNALEPYIDEETMRFHHDKHYATYIKNLNTAVNKYPSLKNKSAEALLKNLDTLPNDIRTSVRNNGGGYVNHKMFWEIMSSNGGEKPTGEIAQAITTNFGSFEAFQKAFNEAGSKVFGSGWAWLVLDKAGKLQVISTPNQDSPLMEGLYPIMGNDVWEHAYYLKYRNNRADYLKQWWNVINWQEVNRRFLKAKTL